LGEYVKRDSLYFSGSGQVIVKEESLPPLASGEVLVKALCSAISPGTEMLFFRGLAPVDIAVDKSISALSGTLQYPLKYGYSMVGRVVEIGREVAPHWLDKIVFAFQPHESYFTAEPDELIPLPAEIPLEAGVFLPNMETAVNLLMDGAPVIGERVVVFGQGIVGLLTAGLLVQYPLNSIATLDCYPLRRKASLDLGVDASLDPGSPQIVGEVKEMLGSGADLTYELSGDPGALDQALAITGAHGRVVIGSWYGTKRANLDLGGHFHRSGIRLLGSQVSTIAPHFSGRWSKGRRLKVAWDMIRKQKPERYITHRFPLKEASAGFNLLDQNPEDAIQLVLTY
jgi:2-desacetyl-2-hydroxyethyl bacteriochlorophyllide A dehydrogenase